MSDWSDISPGARDLVRELNELGYRRRICTCA